MKKLKRVAATFVAVLAAMSATALTACSNARDGSHIVFCSYGDESELAIYTEMVDEFNKTYGAEHNIKVDHTPIGITGYNNYIQSMSTARNSYDVCVVIEDRFKAWATTGIIGPMEEYFNAVTDIDVSDVFPNTVNRLRLNVSNNTSNLSDPLYGMPLDTKPSALYYNESMLIRPANKSQEK